ncbi:unnamed protein product [Cunninghamella echinulata]
MFNKSLSIDLIEPIVYLHGPKDKHRVNILRGIIKLKLKKSIHMDSITIQFIGISKTLWPEASQHWDKQILVDTVIPICRSSMYLKKGTHVFPFEILLSNSLSESIECGLGHVRYKIICQVNTSTSTWKPFSSTKGFKAKQNVILVRLPSQDSPRCITQTHHINEQEQLNIVLETAHLTPGHLLPFTLHFSNPDHIQSIHQMTVKLIERQKFRAPSRQTTRILHHEITLQQQQQQQQQQQNNEDEQSSWIIDQNDIRFNYMIPDSQSLQVHPSTTNRMIRVRHWIQLSFTVLLKNGEQKEIWMDTPIHVLLASLDDYLTLPAYQPLPSSSSSSTTSQNTLDWSSIYLSKKKKTNNNSYSSKNHKKLIQMINPSLRQQQQQQQQQQQPYQFSPSPSSSSSSSSSSPSKPNIWISNWYARHKEIFCSSSLPLPPLSQPMPPSYDEILSPPSPLNVAS